MFLGSLVILGGFVAMGQRVKDIMECDVPYNPSHCLKKNNDVVRLVRASECEVNGNDICSAAFARRWRGFVVAVHRAFAILAQERATILCLCMFLSNASCYLASCDTLRHQR